MQEEIKIRRNKSYFQKNLYLCWNRECLMEQGDTGSPGELGRIKSKLRFRFCKQLCTWLIGVCEPGCLSHHPPTPKTGHTSVCSTKRSSSASQVISLEHWPCLPLGLSRELRAAPSACPITTRSTGSRLSPGQGRWSSRSSICSSVKPCSSN